MIKKDLPAGTREWRRRKSSGFSKGYAYFDLHDVKVAREKSVCKPTKSLIYDGKEPRYIFNTLFFNTLDRNYFSPPSLFW